MRLNKKNKKKIIIAVVLGGIATVFLFSSINGQKAEMNKKLAELKAQQAAAQQAAQNPFQEDPANKKTTIVITGQDMKVGDTFLANMLQSQEIKEADAPEGYFKTPGMIVGKKAGKNLVRGQYITDSDIQDDSIASVQIPNSMRAISIPVDRFKGLASYIRVGSSVDILKLSSPPEYIAQNIRIVAFEAGASAQASRYNATPDGAKSTTPYLSATQASAITFLVPTDLVPKLIGNADTQFQIIARNAEDDKVITEEKDLPPPPSEAPPIEIPTAPLPEEPSKEVALAPPTLPKAEPKKILFIKGIQTETVDKFIYDDDMSSEEPEKKAENPAPTGDIKLKDLLDLVK